MTTQENLAAAFAGESQANRKYLAFARKAEVDGLPQLAKLFRATAEAETIHAHAHLKAMDGIKSSVENLKTAIEGEAHEFKEMYPEFLEQARKEGNQKAEFSFAYALAVEEIHHGLYEKALAAVEAGNDLPDADIYVCPVCGNTVEGQVPDMCPVCSVPGKKFTKIE
ncbi:MAG: rubrerythrin family protein [Desulfotignum sp.]|nr:rubrerythrin family protein [Desulfotignum sp.]